MVVLSSNQAALLGDSSFPRILMSASRGEKILRYQGLYSQYSRLLFTRVEDRPIAIMGLERRLLSALNTRGGLGVFDEGDRGSLLQRSLLWHRGPDQSRMTRIVFPVERAISVPSWSWMAYEGGIDYLDLKLGGVDWLKDVHSPWAQLPRGDHSTDGGYHHRLSVTATARTFHMDSGAMSDGKIVYDSPGQSGAREHLCVVLGKQKGRHSDEDRLSFVLIVSWKSVSRGTRNVYERIGAGYLSGRCINTGGTLVDIQ